MSLLALLAKARVDTEPTPTPPPVEVTPPTGPTINVASATSSLNYGGTPGRVRDGALVSTRHRLSVDVDGVVLSWGVTHGGTVSVGGLVRCAVSVEDGAPVIVTVGGADSWRMEPAKTVGDYTIVTDKVPVKAKAGQALVVHAWADVDGDTGDMHGAITTPRATVDPGQSIGPWPDALSAARTPVGTNMSSQMWNLRPSSVVAPSDKISVLSIGDSILEWSWSYSEMALDAMKLAFTESAQGGDGYVYYPGRWPARVGLHAGAHTHLLDCMGINNPNATNALRLWKHARANSSLKIVKTTLLPAFGTTDNWATLEGQGDPATVRPEAWEFNRWLRDGAPLSADKETPLAAGSTDAGAVRCTTVNWDGSITTRDQGHPLMAVVDSAAAVTESLADPRYNATARAAFNGARDGLHPPEGVHKIVASRLQENLRKLGL